ncbi:MAG: hypothetical protein MI806_26000 [Minwuiales bacterium]|nr:hypothetical protein [Minwuiales bacterium]
MDAEFAVEWCFRKQQAHRAVKWAGLIGTVGFELIAARKMDRELRSFLTNFPIHPDAAIVYLAVSELTGQSRKLVRACGRVGRAPDWEGPLYMPHTTTVYEPVETVVAGRVKTEYRERDLPMGGPDAAAAARARYLAWHDALTALTGILAEFSMLQMRVIPPICPREPWFAEYRFPGKENRVLDGYEREAFIELAGKGMKPAELAVKFGISAKQAKQLKDNVSRRAKHNI